MASKIVTWIELNKYDSREIFEKLKNNSVFDNYNVDQDKKFYKKNVDTYYLGLYEKLHKQYDDVKRRLAYDSDFKQKRLYGIDLLFGIELYHILNDYGFTAYNACNDDIWRYLSLRVIPDIVYQRWGLAEARYYKTPNRIWLKYIWWYVYLSLYFNEKNGEIDYDKTEEILTKFNSDYALQIVDRSGSRGFNIDFTRKLVIKLYQNDDLINQNNKLKYKEKSRDDTLRNIMKLYTARSKIFDLQLYEGGIDGYINDLFRDILTKELYDEFKKRNNK